jgi:hypothetical protein
MGTFIASSHRQGDLRAIVVWYWADEYDRSPSDSCRMFWL